MENNENIKTEQQSAAPEAGNASASSRSAEAGARRPFRRHFSNKKKVCRLCAEKITHVDYKQFHLIKPYCTETGRILPRKVTGACAKHQRQLARAIKINRNLSLLPYND